MGKIIFANTVHLNTRIDKLMVFPEKTMNVNIPKTSTVSHEVPIFTELARDSGLPVSEV